MPHTKRTEIRTRDDSRKNGVSGRQPCGRLPNHRLAGRKPFKYPLGRGTRARLSSKVPPRSPLLTVAKCGPHMFPYLFGPICNWYATSPIWQLVYLTYTLTSQIVQGRNPTWFIQSWSDLTTTPL